MENKQLVCINNKPFPINEVGPDLTLNKEYTLESVFTCTCKEEHYNVGLEEDVNYIECYKCRETLPKGIRWCHSSRFITKVELLEPYTTGNE